MRKDSFAEIKYFRIWMWLQMTMISAITVTGLIVLLREIFAYDGVSTYIKLLTFDFILYGIDQNYIYIRMLRDSFEFYTNILKCLVDKKS